MSLVTSFPSAKGSCSVAARVLASALCTATLVLLAGCVRFMVPGQEESLEIGTYSLSFDSGGIDGWATADGAWSVTGGHLESTAGQCANWIMLPITLDRSEGVVQMEAALPALDCRAAILELIDAEGASVLSFGPDYCRPWTGESKVVFNATPNASQESWPGDVAWHTYTVEFQDGVYQLYRDQALIRTLAGPERLKAAHLRLGSWQHTDEGTRYDNISIGPLD